jgi:hypothetical protein
MSKFKVGDRVRCLNNSGYEYKLFVGNTYTISESNKGKDSDMVRLKGKPEIDIVYDYRFELIKERTMKDTITLKELIEQGACKEGLLWFIEIAISLVAGDNPTDNYDHDGNGPYKHKFYVKKIVSKAKEDGHHEYIQWLKDHGYKTSDNSKEADDIKAEMKRLKDNVNAEMAKLEKRLEEIKGQ